jgi:flagellar basal body-associated protein FliL
MTTALIAATVVISLAGLGYAAWTMVQTHKEVRQRKSHTSED